ncbi:MAG: hypothetical protein WBL07_10295 [Thiothrix litoralis]|uniref:hypothetical protein n=1 Tax=Thiothrix litoralis TaxID=2891210 RepID=UPI003C75E796
MIKFSGLLVFLLLVNLLLCSVGNAAAPPLAGFTLDPDTDFNVWRLGGSSAEMQQQCPHPDGEDNITLLHAQHFYSRTSPANRTETHALGSAGQNHPYAALWRLSDKRLVGWVPTAEKEADLQQRQLLWDRQADNVYWFTDGNRLMRASIDFSTYKTRVQEWAHFPDFAWITFGMGEGNFSDDGKRLVLAGAAQGGSGMYIQPYEVADKRALPWRKVAASVGDDSFDWASVDPTGEYVLFAQHAPQEAMLVVPFAETATASPRVLLDDVKHSDIALDREGIPWLVYGNWRGLFKVKLADAHSQRIWPDTKEEAEPDARASASGHVARIAGKPGWVLMSRHQDGSLYQVSLDGKTPARHVGNSRQGRGPRQADSKQTARRWGVTRDGEVTTYKREARAASSPSGRYVFFVSDYHAHASYDPEPEPGTAYLNLIDLEQEP